MDLILASTSPYRRDLLARLGLPFRCVAPGIDEDRYKDDKLKPYELAERLAVAKAQAVADKHPGAVVIGGDQLVALGDKVLGKPGTVEKAIDQLMELEGREHRLITSIALADARGTVCHTEMITLTMRDFDRSAAERYVLADTPLDCAGSYKIESLGIGLFEKIQGSDHTAIIGLPLMALATELRSRGFRIP